MTDSNPRHALYELACRYAQAVDRRNWPRLTTLFTPDATLAGPGFRFDDRDAIVAGMRVIERYKRPSITCTTSSSRSTAARPR